MATILGIFSLLLVILVLVVVTLVTKPPEEVLVGQQNLTWPPKSQNIQFNAHIEMHIIRFITEKSYSTMLQIQYVEYMMNIYR